MNKKITNIVFSKTGLFLFIFLIQIIPVPFFYAPVITDEVNPLAFGFWLRGDNWRQYLIADGVYYKYGQLLFQLPFILFIKDNIVLYQVLLVINAIIVSFIPVCVVEIITRYLRCQSVKSSYGIAFVIGLIPALTLNSKITWAEPFIMLMPWFILILFLNILECKSKRKMWIYSTLLAVVQVYSYMVHTRGVVFLIATLICVCIIRFILKCKSIKMLPYFFATIVMLVIDSGITKMIKNLLYGNSKVLAGSTSDFLNSELMNNFFSMTGIVIWCEEILGWLFTSVCSTFGLTSLGLIASLIIVFCINKWKCYSKQEMIIVVFSLLCMCGSLVLGTAFFFDDVWAVNGMEFAKRGDKLIYVRYLDATNICMSFVGLYYFVIKRNFWTNARLFYAVMLFLVLHGIFLSVIGDRIDKTVTWTSNLMTVNYFCDLSQCIRGGSYSQVNFLSGGIAIFGLLAFLIFLLVVYMRKNKMLIGIYIILFCLCYFWNSYHVLYRNKYYMMTAIESYSDVIRSIQNENLKNIYLDDQILRTGFQYNFSDYYIITERDDNRFDINNMFIILSEVTYNIEYYKGDYYQIINNEDNREGFRLYVKGVELKNALQDKGYNMQKTDIQSW